MPLAARTERPPGRPCHCRGAHLVRMVRRHRPPNCGVSTCRRPMLGRRLDPEAHTEPLPRISGTGSALGGPAATGSGQPAPSVFTPTPPATAPSAAATLAGSPAEPGPSASGPSTATAPGSPAESVPPGAPSAGGRRSAPPAVGSAAWPRVGTHHARGQRGAGRRGQVRATSRCLPGLLADLAPPPDLAAAPTAPAGGRVQFPYATRAHAYRADAPHRRGRPQRLLPHRRFLRRPATAGPPIRAGRGRATAGARGTAVPLPAGPAGRQAASAIRPVVPHRWRDSRRGGAGRGGA